MTKIRMHVGQKGTGKSYAAKRIAEQRSDLVLVWDPQAEWAGKRGTDVPKGKRRVAVRNTADFRDYLSALGARMPADVIAWQMSLEKFPVWCDWVLRTGNCLAVVDEAHLVCTASKLEDAALRLVTTCRHSNVDLLFMTQRPVGVSPWIRDQLDQLEVWATGPDSWAWIEERTKATHPEFVDQLRGLAGRKSARWDISAKAP